MGSEGKGVGSLEGDSILAVLQGKPTLSLVQGHHGPCEGGADERECNESELHFERASGRLRGLARYVGEERVKGCKQNCRTTVQPVETPDAGSRLISERQDLKPRRVAKRSRIVWKNRGERAETGEKEEMKERKD